MEDALCCRICLEDGERREFIAPCACTGSQKWVHRACLDRWRATREDKAFSRCTECLKPYEMVSRLGEEDDDSMITARRCRFMCLIARDFSLALVVSQIVIIVLGLVVFAFDLHSHTLIEALRQTAHPVTFYYLMGLFFGLATLGLFYTLMHIGCCGGGECSAGDCQCYDAGFYPCIYSSPHSTSVCAADCCGCNAECCACCAQQDAVGCGECASAGAAGEECVIIMIVAVVVFALVGAVVCVVLGVAYAQSVIRKHYHVLQKYTLATDFIVADLADGALPIGSSEWKGGANEESSVENNVELGQGLLGLGSTTLYNGTFQSVPVREWAGEEDRNQTERNRSQYSYSRAPTSAEMREDGVELSSLAHSTAPSAPPYAASISPIHSNEMYRNADGATSNISSTATGSSGADDPYAGATAPYDPHLHHFSRRQYHDLVGWGLL